MGKAVVALAGFAATLVFAANASAETRARAFADVPFGSSAAIVREAMKALQFDPYVPVGAGDERVVDDRFEGRFKDQTALVTASYDGAGHLEKMLVSFLTADEECVSFFRTLRKELQQKYGAPVTDIERWEFPYDKGGHVGQEHFAIRIGKGLLATVWEDADAGSTEGGIVITTADNVIVQLAYESSKWAAEAARRKEILEHSAEPTPSVSTPGAMTGRGERARGLD